MCTTCGCGDETETRVTALAGRDRTSTGLHPDGRAHHHHDDGPHDHLDHSHTHVATAAAPRTVEIEERVLAKNDGLAQRNRSWLSARGIVALNVMSSPGSGKTSLLVRTIHELSADRSVAVIEGDQETLLDAERIRATGASVVQINTGAGCHLDAEMVQKGMNVLDPPSRSLLFIENVGNLVCPALFDLGETSKVVVISTTEGHDKPLKYPHMVAAADLLVINKTDLLPYVEFDVEACATHARSVNPGLPVLPLSVTTGAGMDAWYGWLAAL